MNPSVNIAAHHIPEQKVPQTAWLPVPQNGIIRSFVASRKKYLFLKRCFDSCMSLIVILGFLSWLVPLLGLLIRLDSRGPVFFVQNRVGRDGRSFGCIKFRTMVCNREADERPAETDDDRITRVGKYLRHTNLDELPQFINVLLGHMSVIGPRPHMVADCIRFSFIISSYSFRHLVRPGITGWAQVNGYHGPTRDYESVMFRYYWDSMYVRKANGWLDAKILVTTIRIGIKNFFSARW